MELQSVAHQEPLATVLVDDDEEMREVLRHFLRRDPRFTVVGEAATGADAVRLVAEVQPALVVLDIAMPGGSGLDVLPQITLAAPTASVVMLSAYPAADMASPSMRAGAIGYLEKAFDLHGFADRLHALTMAVETAQRILDETYESNEAAPATARRHLRAALASRASPTSLEVIELLTSELVTNAMVHARSPARVVATLWDSTLRVSVEDASPEIPELQQSGPADEGGRGLWLVDRMSQTWGVVPRSTGKAVWFEVGTA